VFHNFSVSPFKKHSFSAAFFIAHTSTAFSVKIRWGVGGIGDATNASSYISFSAKDQAKSARSAVLRQC
jgi:hypothetical protein